ncbi:MAG: hypothetical protein ABT04_00490 [Granulicella sp. SCN 62-9]|nr:MAG: hypothetical protein ABT04_00490 [Granulicella sp. SCN 62-9]
MCRPSPRRAALRAMPGPSVASRSEFGLDWMASITGLGEARIEQKLWLLPSRGGGVEVADDDALADVRSGDLAQLVGLLRIGDAEAREAAVEPQPSQAVEVGPGRKRAQVEQDAHVAAARSAAQVVEIVERADGRIERLRMRLVRLDMRQQDGVGTERVDVVEPLGDALEPLAAEAVRVNLVNDRVLPPRLGLLSEPRPAGTSEHLRNRGGGGSEGEQAGEREDQQGFDSVNRHVREMLPRVILRHKSPVRA